MISTTSSCEIPWGICPKHGNTLSSSGKRTWCSQGHEVEPGRMEAPCSEPVRWEISQVGDPKVLRVCDQHGRDAHRRLVDAVVKPVSA